MESLRQDLRYGAGMVAVAIALALLAPVPLTASPQQTSRLEGQTPHLVHEVRERVPDNPAKDASYLFYLHGRAIEEGGRAPVTEFGTYEYDAILRTLAEQGFVVISEARPAGTDPAEYAKHVEKEVRHLLRAGVRPQQITIAGASKGGVIAMLVSTNLQEPLLNFVLMANCNDTILDRFKPKLAGRVLSIFEQTDDIGRSCERFAQAATGISSYKEVALNTGLRHGFLYRPLPEWVKPLTDWARRDAKEQADPDRRANTKTQGGLEE